MASEQTRLAGVAGHGAGLPETRVGAEAVGGGRRALVRPPVGAPAPHDGRAESNQRLREFDRGFRVYLQKLRSSSVRPTSSNS